LTWFHPALPYRQFVPSAAAITGVVGSRCGLGLWRVAPTYPWFGLTSLWLRCITHGCAVVLSVLGVFVTAQSWGSARNHGEVRRNHREVRRNHGEVAVGTGYLAAFLVIFSASAASASTP